MDNLNYAVRLVWEGNLGAGTSSYAAYRRQFRVRAGNKPEIYGSSDAHFLGDPDRYNPEELLLMSIASCHMLFYLSLCAKNKVIVEQYSDHASCKLKLFQGGGGAIVQAALSPSVVIARESNLELAQNLHAKANSMCFIANSCKFPVIHQPFIHVSEENK